MAPISLSSITNPIVTSSQLVHFKNSSTDKIVSENFIQSVLANSAGILLRLPQETIATALVLLQRYQILSTQPDAPILKSGEAMVFTATIYLVAKLSFTPLSPRSVINVYAYLTSDASPVGLSNPSNPSNDADPDPKSYYVSEGTHEQLKLQLFAAETHVLATLGFDTHVVLPHSLALTYMQTLEVSSPELAERVFEHLNGGLLSPQYVYLTHQPNALAVAAIYLAAREVGVKLVEQNWWEVFDVDREDLGFLVLAFGSLANFARAELARVKTGTETDSG